MKNLTTKINKLLPEQMLTGYSNGVFPMGDSKYSVDWYEAEPRGIMPMGKDIEGIHISRSLKQILKKKLYEVRIDTDFENVILNCANRNETWINKIIIDVYTELYNLGFAHCVEAWKNNRLVGGLYGIALNGAFFGESMFHIEKDASKVCVVRLYEILKQNGYLLFDIQMITPVFKTFGAVHISKQDYLQKLEKAMKIKRIFKY
jgi:leucyl/phenylalanyl-tRNA--protein transferase